MAAAQGETGAPQVAPRSLGGDAHGHRYRPPRRRYHWPSRSLRRLPSRHKLVRGPFSLARASLYPASGRGRGELSPRLALPSFLRSADGRASHRDAFYTTMCNTLDLTTSVFPVTTADRNLDPPTPPHAFYNHEDEAIYKLCMSFTAFHVRSHETHHEAIADDPELFHGLPVCLQLIGRTWEEEGVIAMTEVVDDALKAYVNNATRAAV